MTTPVSSHKRLQHLPGTAAHPQWLCSLKMENREIPKGKTQLPPLLLSAPRTKDQHSASPVSHGDELPPQDSKTLSRVLPGTTPAGAHSRGLWVFEELGQLLLNDQPFYPTGKPTSSSQSFQSSSPKDSLKKCTWGWGGSVLENNKGCTVSV